MSHNLSGKPEELMSAAVFREHLRLASSVGTRLAMESSAIVAEMAATLVASLRAGGKVMFCGNGGSAAEAQHLAAELTGRYLRERGPLPAIALTTDTSAITAIGNDYRFEEIFRRQVEGIGAPGDVLVALSTSGTSADVILAAQTARGMSITVLALTGQNGGELGKHADLVLRVPSADTPIVQELHLAVGHVLCDLIERALIAAPETFGRARAA